MLEQIIDLKSIKGHSLSIFTIGMVYTFIGILSARILFPTYLATMSLAFTSILLIPTISVLMKDEENIIAKERHFKLKVLLKDHKDVIRLYLLMFLGVFTAYLIIGIFSSIDMLNQYFFAQLKVAGLAGRATQWGQFGGILLNNIIILVICLILSLAYGAGSVLFIVWNASVWGVAFGYFIHRTAEVSGVNPVFHFCAIFIPFLPHMITEALSYIVAAIMGGTVSKAIHREKLFSKKFQHIIFDAGLLALAGFILVILAGLIEVFIFPLFL